MLLTVQNIALLVRWAWYLLFSSIVNKQLILFLHVDHFCIHSELWESYTLGIFPCINLFVNVCFVRTWNLLHMDVDTISKDQISVSSKMHSTPFHFLLPNDLFLSMGFTYPPWNWLFVESYFLHNHTLFFFKFAALSFALVNTRINQNLEWMSPNDVEYLTKNNITNFTFKIFFLWPRRAF